MMIKPLVFQGRNLGWIDLLEKCYYGERNFQEHFFYKFNGYGCSVSVLDELQSCGIETIKFIIKDQHKVLTASVSLFLCYGHDFFDKTFGRPDPQLILPIEYFNKNISSEKQFELGVYNG